MKLSPLRLLHSTHIQNVAIVSFLILRVLTRKRQKQSKKFLDGLSFWAKILNLSRYITSYISFSPVAKTKTHRYVLLFSILKFFFVWVKVRYLWNQRPIVQVLQCYIVKVQIFWAGQLFFNLPILSVRHVFNVKKGGIFKK